MAAQTKVYKNYNILVNFGHPDGSTSWGDICYYILVKFDSPDGSTYWFHKYKILVNFDHPDGSTGWDYMCFFNLTLQMAALIGFLNIIKF